MKENLIGKHIQLKELRSLLHREQFDHLQWKAHIMNIFVVIVTLMVN